MLMAIEKGSPKAEAIAAAINSSRLSEDIMYVILSFMMSARQKMTESTVRAHRPRGQWLHAVKIYTVEQFDCMVDDINDAGIPGYGPFKAKEISGREHLMTKAKPRIVLTKQIDNKILNISGTPRIATRPTTS